ncbi:MAG: hypothetical protein KJ799_09170 [Bacteroidetes bacterium]|nr:hypothetical protein [Bacteroidota bacterium]
MFTQYRILLTVVLLLLIVFSNSVFSQESEEIKKPKIVERNWGGPRLGFTYLLAGSALQKKLDEKNIGNLVSQFGWHFEWQVIPEGGGPQFVTEFIPLVGGVEYGTLIPSLSLIFGVRFPNGLEFGLGPNLSPSVGGGAATSIIGAIGKSFDYGGVSIPINLAVAKNPDGTRVSIIFGYALLK